MKNTYGKRIASLIFSLCLVWGLQSVVSAALQTYYASYPLFLDFEDDYALWALGWGMQHASVYDEEYGRALKLSDNDQININLGDSNYLPVLQHNKAVNSGIHIFEFDYQMSDIASNLEMYILSVSDEGAVENQQKFLGFQNGNIINLQTKAVIAENQYSEAVWNHLDLRFDFDAGMAGVYINGIKSSELKLQDFSVNGVASVVFWTPKNDENYVLMDNVKMREAPAQTYPKARYTQDKKIKLNFEESIPEISESDISVNAVSPQGVSENADINIESSDQKNVVLGLQNPIGGYTYSVSISSGNLFGQEIEPVAVRAPITTPINKGWSFDNGDTKYAEKSVLCADENRGKVLKINEGETASFEIDEALTEGVYIFSYDMMHNTNEKLGVNLLDEKSRSANFEMLWQDNTINGHANSGMLTNLSGLDDGQWCRIDNIINLDEKQAEVYKDGAYIGNIDMWSALPSDDKITSFIGAMFDCIQGEGVIDNVRIKDADSQFDAEIYAKDNKVYIDFNETVTGLSNDNFTVEKNEAESDLRRTLDFTIDYQNGTRVILKLGQNVSLGEIYTVRFNNITSFLDKNVASTQKEFEVQGEPIGEIYYIDCFGNAGNGPTVSAAVKKIEIIYPQGVSEEGEARLICGSEEIPILTRYDKNTNTLSITIDGQLQAYGQYTLNLSGWKTQDGRDYSNKPIQFSVAAEDEWLPTGDYIRIKEINYSKNKITASVNNMPADKMSAIMVLNPGYEPEDAENNKTEAICYIAQTKNMENHEFTFTAKEDGEYKIYANVGGKLVYLTAEKYFKLGVNMEFIQGKTIVKDFSHIRDNIPVEAHLQIDNRYKNECDYLLILAIYKDDRLIKVETVKGNLTDTMETDVKALTMNIGSKDEFDTVRAFVWRDTTKIIPVTNYIEIRK